jgi:hypothetical protein
MLEFKDELEFINEGFDEPGFKTVIGSTRTRIIKRSSITFRVGPKI